jgi:predicted Zn-ribbon and HTH transcriptional regulator
MNLDLEPASWEKYRCQECGRTFLSLAKRPTCPGCRSEKVTRV